MIDFCENYLLPTAMSAIPPPSTRQPADGSVTQNTVGNYETYASLMQAAKTYGIGSRHWLSLADVLTFPLRWLVSLLGKEVPFEPWQFLHNAIKSAKTRDLLRQLHLGIRDCGMTERSCLFHSIAFQVYGNAQDYLRVRRELNAEGNRMGTTNDIDTAARCYQRPMLYVSPELNGNFVGVIPDQDGQDLRILVDWDENTLEEFIQNRDPVLLYHENNHWQSLVRQ